MKLLIGAYQLLINRFLWNSFWKFLMFMLLALKGSSSNHPISMDDLHLSWSHCMPFNAAWHMDSKEILMCIRPTSTSLKCTQFLPNLFMRPSLFISMSCFMRGIHGDSITFSWAFMVIVSAVRGEKILLHKVISCHVPHGKNQDTNMLYMSYYNIFDMPYKSFLSPYWSISLSLSLSL